ncbi:hydroxyquinol 1,2-dioxygenase [Pseudomonas sp. M47T1]|nr:hydroxyquinol 1,2-dioxygenase [Pseudomonas sp. M47T1]
MLEALNRHPWRPAHLHFMITAPNHERLVTHVFREGGDYLDSDAVFGVRSSLIANWQDHPPGEDPYGQHIDRGYCTLDFEFVLSPSGFGAGVRA